MMSKIIPHIQQTFDNSKHLEDGVEFWFAREIMPLLGYDSWRRFKNAIEKAQDSCISSGKSVEEHFLPEPSKTSAVGGRPKEDRYLSRLACYLIAMNGDPRKPQIAQAQQYFALQTRRQELYEQQVDEDKRLTARAKLAESETKIEETVYRRGITKPFEFASFKDTKIQTLYGMSTHSLKAKRGIPETRALADFDSEVELKAKDFVYAMTDHNIKEHNIVGKEHLTQELISNASSTRKAMLERGITPENLPPQEDLKIINKRRQAGQALQNKSKRLSQ